MDNGRIQYTARNFQDYRDAMLDISRKYYSDIYDAFNDASIGSWLIDIFADVADAINYHIDRMYQETALGSATLTNSLLAMARNLGCKVPGKKPAIVEVELSCELPLNKQGSQSTGDLSEADESYAPVVRRGTQFSTGLVTFELMENVDFKEQFDNNGISNRQIIPNRDSNGNIISYTYKKLAIAVAGISKVYKKVITNADLKPFMSILLQDSNILGVESILVKDGTNLNTDPDLSEYRVDKEQFKEKYGNNIVERFFEVDNLADQYRFGYEVEENTTDGYYNPVWEEIKEVVTLEDGSTTNLTTRQVMRGQWKRLKNKFVTEYTDNWSLKVTFGAGLRNEYGTIPTDARAFTQYMMSRMTANDYMGVLPEAGKTMYILYRVGGGAQTNIAADTLTNIVFLNMSIAGNCEDSEDASKKRNVQESLKVTNTTPSYGGKDEPSNEELKYLIKYNSAAQNRCVTLHDYEAKIITMPPKYGTPFRCAAAEENNKVVVYALGLDSEGKLMDKLAEEVAENIKQYLSKYRMINDFVEIRSGKIINLGFAIDIFVDKAYDKADVVKKVIDKVYDYMDIRRHLMGEDIFVGDLEKEISAMDGVQNLIALRCYNKVGNGYSEYEITQELVNVSDCCHEEYAETGFNDDNQIDLKASDKMLFAECNSMFEVKYINDITVNVKER